MNERIRELLVEAREQTKEGKWNAPTAVWAEKFAELIIKDCADCIRENYNHESAESIAFQMEIKYGLHTDYGDHS